VIVRLLAAAPAVVDVACQVVGTLGVVDARSADLTTAVFATASREGEDDEGDGEKVRAELHDGRGLSTPLSPRLRQLAASTLRGRLA